MSRIFFIERNGKSQPKLIEDLLDTARIIGGKLRLDLELVDPVSVILEVGLRQNGVAPQRSMATILTEMDYLGFREKF